MERAALGSAMAAPERLELPTVSFEGCRSIQLSYGAAALV